MPKIRVHQLAKELGLDSKQVIEEAAKHGIRVKNHMSSLSDSDEMMLRAFLEDLRPKAPEPEPEPQEVEVPADLVREIPVHPPREEREVRVGPEEPTPFGTEEETHPPQETRPAAATMPREVTARRPGEEPAREVTAETAPAVQATDTMEEPPAEGKPSAPETVQTVQAVRTTTVRPGDAKVVSREPVIQRRQAQILGRKDIPQRRSPQTTGGGAGRTTYARGAGGPGSGLIATRSEAGKRTFVNTGRGRGQGPGGRGPGGPGGRRGPGGQRRRRDSAFSYRAKGETAVVTTPDELTVELPITVKGLSEKLGVKANDIIKKLFLNQKKMVKINDPLDKETVELLGIEYDCDITVTEKEDVETRVLQDLETFESPEENLHPRPPIVAFLGHVDHGKTSLLDAIRRTDVAAKEHGGITQHIGSSRVTLPDGRVVVFVDTPGHRAFTEMRARGAQVTDVVVLVVAADDGVMPQTKEAIAHARAAGVPIVVALNKIDKPDANPMKVRQELAAEGLQDEAWGGDTMIKEVSAVTGQGIEDLIESLLLEAEILELKADPTRPAIATVLEAEQTRGEGNVARLIITDGTLRKGDIFVCGTAYGRIRAIKGPAGKLIKEAGPSMPVQITGLNELPNAGDKLFVLDDLNKAKEIAEKRIQLGRERDIAKKSHVSLENLFEKAKGGTQVLKIILKVDVTGSLQVLQREIMELTHPEVRPEIIHADVGGVTESDVVLADASDAVILGFHVTADMGARKLAEEKKVEIRIYQVLYQLIDDLKDALEGRLAPEMKEVITGEAEVRQTWRVSRLGVIAGCFVRQGVIKRDSKIRVSRNGIVVHDNGSLESLKRFKDDVREVKEGFECGMLIKGFDNIQEGDTIIAYEIEKVKRSLE